jgi:stage II sporulation SpoE-like protein
MRSTHRSLISPRRVAVACLAVWLLFVQSGQVHAEQAEPEMNHEFLIRLDGLWRFHAGDNPAWTRPDFDDSAWPLVRSDQSRTQQSLPVASGLFWYRTQVVLPPGHGPLALFIPSVNLSYEVFLDGKPIGGMGRIAPFLDPTRPVQKVFELPIAASPQTRTVTLAIRCWRWPRWSQFFDDGLRPGIRVGEAPLIEQFESVRIRDLFWNQSGLMVLNVLEALAGFACLSLFWFRRKDTEYLWYGVYNLLTAADGSMSRWIAYYEHSVARFDLIQELFDIAVAFALIAFLNRLLNGRRNWLFWLAVAASAAKLVVDLGEFVPILVGFDYLPVSVLWWNGISTLGAQAVVIWMVTLLVRKAWEGHSEARLLLPSLLLAGIGVPLDFLLFFSKPLFGWQGSSDWFYRTFDWPFPFSIKNIADAGFLLTMLAILIQRFSRTARQQDDLRREQEAARTVQQMLIPDTLPPIPGFEIRAVYRPFGEVGGDFFQIIPVPQGALIVLGDVSGKGLPAAMTVSLLVGTLRTLAHYTQSPGEILAAMNQRMLGRNNGGFTTCLVLTVSSAGILTAANAGHIPPYLNGHELLLENGLPIGIAAGIKYPEITFTLPPDARLTLLTDGILEATSPATKELFGFARTAAIGTQSAEAIALAAQQFGQEDDITVLTLTFSPAPDPVEAIHA